MANSLDNDDGSSSHDLFSYLESLPPNSLLSLYADPTRGQYACRAVLQRLPDLARQYVLRLAVSGGSFPRKEVEKWHSGRGKRDAYLGMKRMEQLCVVVGSGRKRGRDDDDDVDDDGRSEQQRKKDDVMVRLTPQYLKGIQSSITSLKSAPWNAVTARQRYALEAAEAIKLKESGDVKRRYPPPPTFDELETYTQRRWDSVLHFLVGSVGTGVEDPPGAVVHFLEKTGLMQNDPDWTPSRKKGNEEPPLVITSKGYEFMLQEVHVQVWQFIVQYFKSLASHRKCDEIRTEALLFLICLSYCRVGEAYPASDLSKDGRVLMQDFSQFGLLCVCRIGGMKVFYPTRVAVNLVTGSLAEGGGGTNEATTGLKGISSGPSASATRALESALASPTPSKSHIAIIVQTNFQLCAYTTSELHVSMLGLFCDISNFRRLPNVIFYKITRDSVKSAFKLGIEARQILRFLKMHAHPRLRTGDQPLIPSNVEDQILLWDRERSRVVLDEVWVHQCQSAQEFRAVRQYAMDHGAYAWSTDVKNKIMIKYGKAELVMAFVRRWRVRQARQQQEVDGGGPLRPAHRTSYA